MALIPVIEQLDNSGLPVSQKFPYDLYGQVANDFSEIVYKMPIVLVFDWMDWIKDKPYFEDDFENFNDLSLIELCQVITVIVRNDRFSDYFIQKCMHSQIILKILQAIELKVNQTKSKNFPIFGKFYKILLIAFIIILSTKLIVCIFNI